ncbi:hypothetical protein LR68_02010 [Anoxybacillus sp. BCO1]|nr:hypothetical protein LR68_02010 [Anoxybacillus sp. BCO1]
MDIILYSSIALIAIAFLTLVIYVVQTLKNTSDDVTTCRENCGRS